MRLTQKKFWDADLYEGNNINKCKIFIDHCLPYSETLTAKNLAVCSEDFKEFIFYLF